MILAFMRHRHSSANYSGQKADEGLLIAILMAYRRIVPERWVYISTFSRKC